MKDRPRDYAAVVRRHHPETIAWLLAASEPCTSLRDDEVQRIRRDLRPLDPDTLSRFRPSGSWLLAVIVCPGDDLGPLSEWVAALDAKDHDRVRFYAHPDVDIVAAFKPWYAHGFDDPLVEVAHDWRSLHPPFGRDLNDRVYRDAP